MYRHVTGKILSANTFYKTFWNIKNNEEVDYSLHYFAELLWDSERLNGSSS